MKKPNVNRNDSKTEREINLIFEGDKVSSSWYDKKLEEILCALCGRECKDKSRCVNANP